jgi:pyruvate/2-oxoglutarate dehydrogenase complex dihydrolipoamide dehydrogenase (E3) component
VNDRDLEDVDLLVIGGGKAGKSLAMDRAKAGWKVAMVERDKIGGTCINVACIPTKALVGSARTVLAARNAEVMGVELEEEPLVSVDGLRQHKSSVVDGMVAAHRKMFADHWAPHCRDQNPQRRSPVAPGNRCSDQHRHHAGTP